MARAIIEFMRWTGCRPGEACALKLRELDTSTAVWIYTPIDHKTAHHGRQRVIPIGPKGQQALIRFLKGRLPAPEIEFNPTNEQERLLVAKAYERVHKHMDAMMLRDVAQRVNVIQGYVCDYEANLFDPERDRLERYAEMRSQRSTKVQPSQISRKKNNASCLPGKVYSPRSLHHAVVHACRRAGVTSWHPNQLRHLRASEIRRVHGLEAAQVVLGHPNANTTEIYAERDMARALEVASLTG